MWRNRQLALWLGIVGTVICLGITVQMLTNISSSSQLVGAAGLFYVMICISFIPTLICAYVVFRALFSDKWES
jgi:hypothetical protein